MKYHEIANIWPMMGEAEIAEMAEDIRQNGQAVPIWLYEGKILDGRNRWEACKIVGIQPHTKTYTGDSPTAFAVSLNSHRRHLKAGQKAALAVELEPFYAKDAKKRQQASGGDRKSKVSKSVVEKIPQPIREDVKPAPKAREEAAKSVGVNDRYVSDAKKLKDEAPEVFDRLKAGKVTMQEAKRELNKKPTDPWSESERERQQLARDGWTVVANAGADKNLVAWAESKGLAVRIDRGTKYGNPFVMGKDGDRDYVCECFKRHYLPKKKWILEDVEAGELSGVVLVCHCFPERCHGDALAELGNKE